MVGSITLSSDHPTPRIGVFGLYTTCCFSDDDGSGTFPIPRLVSLLSAELTTARRIDYSAFFSRDIEI